MPRLTGPDGRSDRGDRVCSRCGGTGQILDPSNPSAVIRCPSCGGGGRTGGSSTRPDPAADLRFPDEEQSEPADRVRVREFRRVRNDVGAAADNGAALQDALATYTSASGRDDLSDLAEQVADVVERLTIQQQEWDARFRSGLWDSRGRALERATRDTAAEAQRLTQLIATRMAGDTSPEANTVLTLLGRFRALLSALISLALFGERPERSDR